MDPKMNGDESSQPLSMNSLDCSWDYTIELECIQGTQDLQLAAELGKTLLERNKDLENSLKHQQNIIEDNNQEIEYLTKQTIALKEVNESRLRIYEQLEVNIQDLERAKHRLVVENSADKKLIKNLTSNVETLEAKCEELQAGIEDFRAQVDVLRRRPNNNVNSNLSTKFASAGKRANTPNSKFVVDDEEVPDRDFSESTTLPDVQNDPKNVRANSPSFRHPDKSQETQTTPNREDLHTSDVINAMEQIDFLVTQLRESRDQYSLDQHRIMELEEHLTAINDQNRSLEKRLSSLNKKEELGGKTMHEEFTTLEEVRQGQLCQRCLRTVEHGNGDCDLSSLYDVDLEDDDHSMIDALTSATSAAASGITPNQQRYRTSFNIEIQEYAKNSPPQVNLYKELIEKYEAVLELQRSAAISSISRQDDPRISDKFSTTNPSTNLILKDTDDESGQGDSLQPEKQSKQQQLSQTPTDFSEAETSSSGFADETSNKATQTSLTDPEDKNSYDNNVDGRFNANPEYKELFRDIFNTLKKDVEKEPINNKDELAAAAKCQQQNLHQTIVFADNLTDDSRSVLSCGTMSDVSVSQLEPVTVIETKLLAKQQDRVLTPYVREQFEYISVAVNARKRSSSRRNKKHHPDRSDSPMTHIVGSPTVTYSNRPNSGQRKQRQSLSSKGTPERPPATNPTSNNNENVAWNGTSLQFFNRNAPSPTPSQTSCKSRSEIEFKPSQASHDLHALKKLEKSYAEVLKKSTNPMMAPIGGGGGDRGQRRAKYT